MSHHGFVSMPPSDSDLRAGAPGRRRRTYGPGSGVGASPASPLASLRGALGILGSCGLEPADLALPARLPEDKVTVESPPPHLLRRITSGGDVPKPTPVPSTPSDRQCQDSIQLVRYPLEHIVRTKLPTERVGRRQSSRPPSRSSRRLADAGPGRDRPPPISGRARVSSEAPARGSRGSGSPPGHAAPSARQVRDFYGAEPPAFPTSCSLCNACVMSAQAWIRHINGPHHADGQLGLLRRFPAWDCSKESLSVQEAGRTPGSAADGRISQGTKSFKKKPARKSDAVPVKFPARSADGSDLRILAEPFGSVASIRSFPSLSSRVLSFTPPPQSNNDKSDLLSVVKRFGPPTYTLFRPSEACVEMENPQDAEKMVDYYSSRPLRINNNTLRVSFAAEHCGLRTTAFAQRYQEESSKWMRSTDDGRMSDGFNKRRGEDCKAGDGKAPPGSGNGKDRSKSADGKARSGSRDRKNRSAFPERSSSSGAKMPEAEKPETTASGDGSPALRLQPTQAAGHADSDSAEDHSDIEGMAVLGDDLDDDCLEDEDDVREDSPELEGQACAGATCDAEPHSSRVAEETRDASNTLECARPATREGQLQETAAEPEAAQSAVLLSDGYSRLVNGSPARCDVREAGRRKEASAAARKASSASNRENEKRADVSAEWENSIRKIQDRKSSDCVALSKSNKLQDFESQSRRTEIRSPSLKTLDVVAEDMKADRANEWEDENTRDDQSGDRKTPENKSDPGKALQNKPEGGNSCNVQSKHRKTPQNEWHGETETEKGIAEVTSKGGTPLKVEWQARKRRKEAAASRNDKAPRIKSRRTCKGRREAAVLRENPKGESASSEVPEQGPDRADGRREDNSCETLRGGAADEDARTPAKMLTDEERAGQAPTANQSCPKAAGNSRTPHRPVGTEFVRPVVGYMCSLCQLIYADEDRAKVRHCSSRRHRLNYQVSRRKRRRVAPRSFSDLCYFRRR